MKRRMKPIRATLCAVTMNSAAPLRSSIVGIVGVSPEPTTATLEFKGAHGPIRVEVPTTAVSALVDMREPNKISEARYEVTIRRLRRASRRNDE